MTTNRDGSEAALHGRLEVVAAQPRGFSGGSVLTEGSPDPLLDEAHLISLSQQGDGDAFARLYDRYVDRINRYIFFRVDDDRVAEDIAAHVFMKMWEKLPAYQVGQMPIGAWLYRIAHNAIIDHYRTRKESIRLDELNSAEAAHDDRIEEQLDLQIELQQLRGALTELTVGQREVLILKFIDGFSTEEVAQQLGKAEGAVRALQMRGLRELARSPSLQAHRQAYA